MIEETIQKAVKNAVSEEFKEIAEKHIQKAVEEMKARLSVIVASAGIKLLNNVSIYSQRNEIIIKVDFEPDKKSS